MNCGLMHPGRQRRVYVSRCVPLTASHLLLLSPSPTQRQIDLSEVETWILKATSAGLLDARMDQLKGEVVISRYTQREFTTAHWAALQTRLHAWQDNVGKMLTTLQSGSRRVGGR